MKKEDGIIFDWVSTICLVVITCFVVYFVYTILDKVETIENQSNYVNEPSIEMKKEIEEYRIKEYLEDIEKERD